MADLTLPRGQIKILKAEDEDYDRGLLVKLLDEGGYKMAYWYNKPDKPYPVEVLVDGKSIKKDAKIVEMKFHPKNYYDNNKNESIMKTFHIDEPREIGKKKERLSSREKMMVKKDMSERLNITTEQATKILDNFCIFCHTPVNEDLRKWFGKGGQGGAGGGGWDRYSSTGKRLGKCGGGKEGDAYAACLSKSKAKKLGRKGIAAFVKRKRAAQKKGGDPKKGGERRKGQKTIKVKTGT